MKSLPYFGLVLLENNAYTGFTERNHLAHFTLYLGVTRVSGRTGRNTVEGDRFGVMVQSTKVTGETTWRVEEVDSSTAMETSTKDSGWTIKLMVKECTFIKMVRATLVNGLWINNTG